MRTRLNDNSKLSVGVSVGESFVSLWWSDTLSSPLGQDSCVTFQQNCDPGPDIGCFSVMHPNQLHEYGKTKQNNALWYPVWLPLVGQQLMENTLSEHYVLPENVLGLMDDVIGCQLNTFSFTEALKWVTWPYVLLGKQLCEDNAAPCAEMASTFHQTVNNTR